MAALAAPLSAGKRDAWKAWIDELKGPRKAEFEDMNARHGLTAHEAYLQPAPDGNYLVIVIHGGPGGDGVMERIASSDNEFDRWFVASVMEIHEVDPSGPMPAAAERIL